MKSGRSFVLTLAVASALLVLWGWRGPNSVTLVPAQRGAAPDPLVTGLMDRVDRNLWLDLNKGLSGEHPVTVGGQSVTFKTRYTPSEQGTLSEQYVYEYFQSLGMATSFHSWQGSPGRCAGIAGRNVVAEIRGSKEPSRIYLITAHLDSTSPSPFSNAPGADDDGSGTTAVMLAARILRAYKFDYTLRFVAFTGEERGLCGSNRYAADARGRNEDIRGALNLDMIAYDSNGVKDVEIHAGTRPDSQEIANLLVSNIGTYSLNLVPHILTDSATVLSDHASFWASNYAAIAAAEYLFSGDGNPYIHSVKCCDTSDHLDLDMATDYTKAAVATLAILGGVQQGSYVEPPAVPPTFTPLPPVSRVTPTLPALQIVPGDASHHFVETDKSLKGLFLDYWTGHGGLAQQGYPISDLLGEVSELNGKPYTMQYTERAVFEYHPENQPPYNVLLSQLGTFQYKGKYPNGAPNQKANSEQGSVLFQETGKRVGGKFLEYWKAHGGLAQQGYPISDEFTEKSDLNGKTYLVQYFERAVFELHPENSPPNDVLLSQLGTFRYRQHYGGK
ncbi:MAG TPA: M28 family peptidase [Chloroflexia bacterium]|nr:M28 family peptidase [Chloroflexia bacterium]